MEREGEKERRGCWGRGEGRGEGMIWILGFLLDV